jgi:hypothetical protein
METRLSTKRRIAEIDLGSHHITKRGKFHQHLCAMERELKSRECALNAKHDAREAESELEQKAFKEAIQDHHIHLKFLQELVTKAETKVLAAKLYRKKYRSHFQNLLETQRKAHECEVKAHVKAQQDSEHEAHESQRQVHLYEMDAQLQDSEDNNQTILVSERKVHHHALMEAEHKSQTALQSGRSAPTLREEVILVHFQGLLRFERMAHSTHETKCLTNFQSLIKDERDSRFETQRLLESERETRMMMCERTLTALGASL